MIGRRVVDDTKEPYKFQSGEYGYWKGILYCTPPGTDLIGNLSGHSITEHEDGTITVAPSILINRGRPNEWHGFLKNGAWTTAMILLFALLSFGCAGPQVGAKLDPKLLPAFPEYSVQPMEIPCGTERCLVIRKTDQVYLVKWLKAACFTLTGDRAYCQMESVPLSDHPGAIIPTGGHP